VFLFAYGTGLAQQPYTNTAELLCDGVKLQVLTQCADDPSPIFPDCTHQHLTFTKPGTDKVMTRSTTAKRVSVTDAQGQIGGWYLDALVNAWACVKGASQAFLLLRYSTGGNCETCEWIEIYDLAGDLLATSRGEVTGNAYKHFKSVYERLRLPKPWPRLAFVKIPLGREKKDSPNKEGGGP